jgi:hypothetical protein
LPHTIPYNSDDLSLRSHPKLDVELLYCATTRRVGVADNQNIYVRFWRDAVALVSNAADTGLAVMFVGQHHRHLLTGEQCCAIDTDVVCRFDDHDEVLDGIAVC